MPCYQNYWADIFSELNHTNQILIQNLIWLGFLHSKFLQSLHSQSQLIAHSNTHFQWNWIFSMSSAHYLLILTLNAKVSILRDLIIKLQKKFLCFLNYDARTIAFCDWRLNDRQKQSFCLSFILIYRSKKPLILDVIVIVIGKLWLISYVCYWDIFLTSSFLSRTVGDGHH